MSGGRPCARSRLGTRSITIHLAGNRTRPVFGWRERRASVFQRAAADGESARSGGGAEIQFCFLVSGDVCGGREYGVGVLAGAGAGLCILFFAAKGRNGEDLFSSTLAERTGEYRQYHHGDINALHVSYFRRRWPEERAFHTCNLRKSYGFHMVAQGADPLPPVADATPPYRIQVVKCGAVVAFSINELPIFSWRDDGVSHGPVLGGGKIGFRQMAPLVGEYANLVVRRAVVSGQ